MKSWLLLSEVYHHWINHDKIISNSYCWEVQNINAFDELLISWNGLRPKKGYFAIYVSINTEIWSPWLLYAYWGCNFQKGFISNGKNLDVQVHQDGVQVLQYKVGKGFKIKIMGENEANLTNLKSIHVCASILESISYKSIPSATTSYLINVRGLSQMALPDTRKERLCSPTSTTAVVRFLKNDSFVDPIQFAENCWDSGFDIFGNWAFNIAEAYNALNNKIYSCWVERLQSFQQILKILSNGFPTVISVKGPLSGSAQPYKNGHLLAVIGYDHKTCEVICMDPAFKEDVTTRVRYKLDDLLKAWERRKNVTYVFDYAHKCN